MLLELGVLLKELQALNISQEPRGAKGEQAAGSWDVTWHQHPPCWRGLCKQEATEGCRIQPCWRTDTCRQRVPQGSTWASRAAGRVSKLSFFLFEFLGSCCWELCLSVELGQQALRTSVKMCSLMGYNFKLGWFCKYIANVNVFQYLCISPCNTGNLCVCIGQSKSGSAEMLRCLCRSCSHVNNPSAVGPVHSNQWCQYVKIQDPHSLHSLLGLQTLQTH